MAVNSPRKTNLLSAGLRSRWSRTCVRDLNAAFPASHSNALLPPRRELAYTMRNKRTYSHLVKTGSKGEKFKAMEENAVNTGVFP